jgi:hypothetical protein
MKAPKVKVFDLDVNEVDFHGVENILSNFLDERKHNRMEK